MLQIRTTGLEDYLPGGTANIKAMIVGGPDAGKTRWASFWPHPIYANCEAGLASVADRGVPYSDIKGSDDMLQFLKYLQQECRRPKGERKYRTVVVDTLDSFLRKVKDEWLQSNPNMSSFSGFDAWGYLDAKMQMLMTRLLNLDMNVIVLVHYKDKTRTEGTGEAKVEIVERMLQLQGDIKDSAFNDFDLVGLMSTFWASDGEKRVEKRGITFRKNPEWPFLKDRLGVTPAWMEVTFADSDYDQLFAAVMSRVDDLPESGVVEEVESIPDENEVARGPLSGGPVPPQDPKDMPLEQLKKDELYEMAMSMSSISDKVKRNTLKADMIALIEQARAQAPEEEGAPDDGNEEARDEYAAGTARAPEHAPEEVKQAVQQDEEGPDEPDSSTETASTSVQKDEPDELPEGLTRTPSGEVVDTDGGEILTPEQVAERLGAEVVSDSESVDTAKETPAQTDPENVCEVCGKDLAGENSDYVRLAWIKWRQKLCNEHYREAKSKQK